MLTKTDKIFVIAAILIVLIMGLKLGYDYGKQQGIIDADYRVLLHNQGPFDMNNMQVWMITTNETLVVHGSVRCQYNAEYDSIGCIWDRCNEKEFRNQTCYWDTLSQERSLLQ